MRFYPHLDALRAVAALCVVVEHTTAWAPGAGAVGVRLFFVLSGFLITGILRDARQSSTDRARIWWAFCARRALRIFPLAYLAIAVLWWVDPARVGPEMRVGLLTYTTNVVVAQMQDWPPMGHYWSLAVEEQFYLLWPLLLLWVPMRWERASIWGVVIASTLGRAWIALAWGHIPAIVLLRMDALAIGAACALAPQVRPLAWRWCALALLGVAVLSDGPLVHHVLREGCWLALSVAVVQRAVLGFPGVAGQVASWRPVVALGTVSYGLYVWHGVAPFLIRWVERRADIWLRFEMAHGPKHFAWVLATTLVLCALSWWLVERPLLRLKRYLPYAPARPSLVRVHGPDEHSVAGV